MSGTLFLDGAGRVTVSGNSLARVADNGNAIIVGNDFIPDSPGGGDPIVGASDGSTIFGNRFLGPPNGHPINSLVSDHGIRLQSRDEAVEIRAGNTLITVDANGDITIAGENDLGIGADGDISCGFPMNAFDTRSWICSAT